MADLVKPINYLKTLFIRKVQQFYTNRLKWLMRTNTIEASGESNGLCNLIRRRTFKVRLSGQDSQRGTFSHRHALLKKEDSEKEIHTSPKHQ
ncbi:MAG: hypothetical protein R2852_04925 [Bacteroidia bacterium]